MILVNPFTHPTTTVVFHHTNAISSIIPPLKLNDNHIGCFYTDQYYCQPMLSGKTFLKLCKLSFMLSLWDF